MTLENTHYFNEIISIPFKLIEDTDEEYTNKALLITE